MNRERILAVADAIEMHSVPNLGFNMGAFLSFDPLYLRDMSEHNCGSTACIIGWAYTLMITSEDPPERVDIQATQLWLDLDENQFEMIYVAQGRAPGMLLEDVRPEQAVKVLRHFAETGTVDWMLP